MIDGARGWFAARIRELWGSERGIALPVALMITVVAMGFAAVPIVAAVNSQGGDSHDQGGNEALAAAEAGAELAVLNQSRMRSSAPEQECVNGQPTVAEGNAAGWCLQEPAVPGEVGQAHYTYRVLPCYVGGAPAGCDEVATTAECTDTGSAPIQVVSTGTALVGGRELSRRVRLDACATESMTPEQRETLERLESELVVYEEAKAPLEGKLVEWEEVRAGLEEVIQKEEAEGATETKEVKGTKTEKVEREVPPPNVFASGSIVGIDSLVMNNNAQVYNGGAGTNGAVSMEGSANVCGTVQYVTTKVARNGSENAPSGCAAGRTFLKTSPVTYPAVSLPSDIATNNSNARLAAADPVGPNVWQRGNIAWNSSNRTLTVNYDQLTLEGTSPYFLCRLVLAGGSKLLAGTGKSIRIFFDAPQNCPGLNGAPQLVIANGASVGPDSNHGPGFYFVGSTTTGESKIELAGGANISQFVIYAPYTKIIANNGVNLNGIIIGRSLELGGGASINRTSAFTPPSTTEFLSPERKIEEIQVATSETVQTVFGKHKEELRKLEDEILKLSEEIAGVNAEQIKRVSEEINRLLGETSGPGSSESSAFQNASFIECSATSTGVAPDAGC